MRLYVPLLHPRNACLCFAITIFLWGTNQAKTQLLSHLHRPGFIGGDGGSCSYSCEALKVLAPAHPALPALCRCIPGQLQPPARGETPVCDASAASWLPEKRRKTGEVAHGQLFQDSGNAPLLQRGLVFMQCCRLLWGEGCLEQPQAQG